MSKMSINSRAGVAMIMVMGLLVLVISIVFIASSRSTTLGQDSARFDRATMALHALNAVLARHERDVSLLSTIGDAGNFSNWSGYFGRENYGIDYVGNCEVRWKVEPARSADKQLDAAGNPILIPYVVNPSPDANYSPGSGTKELVNSSLYMFRVSAEAREYKDGSVLGTGNLSEVTARAQGARYVTINRSPLFRYVIYYVQEGAKGDLELSHADGVNIKGNIYSNGSIYLGGGLKVNDASSQLGTVYSDPATNAWTLSNTLIGPDSLNANVIVRGYDGIFRLSKPLMFSIINELPITKTDFGSGVGSVTDKFLTTYYNTNAKNSKGDNFPLESTSPASSNLDVLTNSGKSINPYRFIDESGAITRQVSGADALRKINGVAIVGYPDDSANDSRDDKRVDDRKWVKVAASEFKNYPKTQLNGGVKDPSNPSMSNRPLEAQSLVYRDADGDLTTDDHEYAQPVFVREDNGNDITELPSTAAPQRLSSTATGRVIEKPGFMLGSAMGANLYMVRKDPSTVSGETGWDVRTRDRIGAQPPQTDSRGIIIRERPIPNTNYWPGAFSSSVQVVPPTHSHYMPYAYGKHWYPITTPFTNCDVSDNLLWGNQYVGNAPSVMANIDPNSTQASYDSGGRLSVVAAANPGPSSNTSNARAGGFVGYQPNNANYYGTYDKQYFFRDAWRFIHLGQMKPSSPAVTGSLDLVYYSSDTSYSDESAANSLLDRGLPFSSLAPASKSAVAIVDGLMSWGAVPNATNFPANTWWSCRWVGFINPTTSGAYKFNIGSGIPAEAAIRVMIDRTIACELNMISNVSAPSISMNAGINYKIVIDLAWKVVGPIAAGTRAPQLQWTTGATFEKVPSVNFVAPLRSPAIPTANFNFVQCRIDAPQAIIGPDQQKVGLMVRPERVLSPLLQGGGAYAMVGWSPVRGFFTQRRLAPTAQELRYAGTVFIGNGGPGLDAAGQVTSLDGVNLTAGLKSVTQAVATEPITYETGGKSASVVEVETPTIKVNSGLTVTAAGGNTWTLLTPFKIGQYVVREEWTAPTKRARQRKNIIQTMTLTGQVPGAAFLGIDDNRKLNFYGAPPTLAGAVNGNSGTMGYQSNGRTWFFSNAAGVALASPLGAGGATSVSRNWGGAYAYGPYVYGTAQSGAKKTLGTEKTAWCSTTIQINKTGVVSTATISDLNSILANNGLPTIDAIKTKLPGLGDTPDPIDTTPANAACSAPTATLANPTVGFTVPADGVAFSVTRNSLYPRIDVNSWITTNTPWRAVPMPAYFPRGTTNWPLEGQWVGTPNYPLSGGLRPDVHGATAPLLSVLPSGSALPGISASGLRGVAAANITAAGQVSGAASTYNGYAMADDIRPTGWNTASEIWLRIERNPASNVLTYWGYVGTTPPSSNPPSAGWTQIGVTDTLPAGIAGGSLLVGPCVQSGLKGTATQVTFADLSMGISAYVGSDDINGDNVVNSTDWDQSISRLDDYALYMMSQYQVWLGSLDITEDFFLFRDSVNGRRIASEDWFYNTREFWSQSRWWDHGTVSSSSPENLSGVSSGSKFYYRVEKDPFADPSTTFSKTTNRELLAKTTVLSLDVGVLQTYIRTRPISQAIQDRVTTAGPGVQTSSLGSDFISRWFLGVLYVARTNRYPWNPATNPLLDASSLNANCLANPYSVTTDSAFLLPNARDAITQTFAPEIRNGKELGANMSGSGMFFNSVHKLQGYSGNDVAPAFKPQEFHHGVRLTNAHAINWGYGSGGTKQGAVDPVTGIQQWSYPVVSDYGTSGLSVITPSALYLQGSFNIDTHYVKYKSVPAYKYTPVSLMADSITCLSDNWSDAAYQRTGFTATMDGFSGSGALAFTYGTIAANATYNAGIITNNLPTNQQRIIEGQAAPFVDAMQLLENWKGKTLHYEGSLVVLDSRRYTRAFLLDAPKDYGTTPFGASVAADLSSVSKVTTATWASVIDKYKPYFFKDAPASSRESDKWSGSGMSVYAEPIRGFSFNQDFLTSKGTPPLVPFGVQSNGVGGWARVVQ